jgi:hypothetical protein
MTFLPDVNVWIALAVVEHTHHTAAVEWAQSADWDALAFCRVTQLGFLRLLANRHVMGEKVLTRHNAWLTFDALLSLNPGFTFAKEPPGLDAVWRVTFAPGADGPNAWTDAYLAAFAESTGFTLVTFDNGFSKFKGLPIKILQSQ